MINILTKINILNPKPEMTNVNPAQRQAILHEGGHLLIVAGPGTGKTHTLTCRVARVARLAPQLPDGQKILAITFTNKAADEMRQRLFGQGKDLDARVFVGTFHQFCLGVLREYQKQTGLPPDFRIATPLEIESLGKEIWPAQKSRERKLFLKDVSHWKASRFDEKAPPSVTRYNKILREKGMLDFDDLLSETFQLLSAGETIRENIQARYPNIFVDEYQDINPVQHALLKILVGPKGTLTAIGDPNQAIYGFRGSDVKFFETFERDFPGAVTLSLSENYRSAANLLSASGQVMAKAGNSRVPELTAKIYAQGRLTVYEAPTDKAEAEYVVERIEKLVGGTSMFSRDSGRVKNEEDAQKSFGDIAVLYRLNSERLSLLEAFDRSGIPYEVSGKGVPSETEDIVDDAYFSAGAEIAPSAEKVSLMTLHAAKGLEFPVVFMIGCEENILPLDLEGMTSSVEEERRLFYVGMTRAKERLYLLRSRRRRLYGKSLENKPSRFLSDIEEELKEYENARLKPKRRSKDEDQLKLF